LAAPCSGRGRLRPRALDPLQFGPRLLDFVQNHLGRVRIDPIAEAAMAIGNETPQDFGLGFHLPAPLT
jgi:hypothetical protein